MLAKTYFTFHYAIFKEQVVEIIGLEPMTPCLQGRCSPN